MPKNVVYDDPEVKEREHVQEPDVREDAVDRRYRALQPPYTPPPKQPIWKKPAFVIGLLGFLVLAAAVATFAYFHYRNRVSTDNAQIDAHIVPIASKIYGTVAEVLVNDNQHVKAGDVLVRIDPRDLQARVDQAKAALQYAESQARAAGAGVPLASQTTASGTSEATAALNAAQADAERARLDAERAATALVSAAQANVQQAQANNDRAQADLTRMRPLAAKEEISNSSSMPTSRPRAWRRGSCGPRRRT